MSPTVAQIEEALVNAVRLRGAEIETYGGERFARLYDDDIEAAVTLNLSRVALDMERELS